MDTPETQRPPLAEAAPTEADKAAVSLQRFNQVAHISGAIAHDFNNILTGLLGNLELLQRRANRLGITDFNEYLAGARSAGERGVSFTQALLAISGHQYLEPARVSAAGCLQTVAGISRAKRPESSISISCAPDMPELFADEIKLHEAVMSVAGIADPASNIHLAACIVSLGVESAAAYHLSAGHYGGIIVRLDNLPLSAAAVDELFEPFVGAHGLTLATVLGFARQSGGHAFVSAHDPHSIEITLVVPLAN